MSASLDLLKANAAAMFVMTPAGRILHENDPDHSPAPRMCLMGCSGGNIVRLRFDVAAPVAETIAGLVAREPAWSEPGTAPCFAAQYDALLGLGAPLTEHNFCVIHRLPQRTTWHGDAGIICHDTPEGAALHARVSRDGLPEGLVEMGFTDVSHFWAPWCVALAGGEIAALAFAARLGARGAEIGVATVPAFRGRGYAAAATAAWSALPALERRALFYSTHRDNVSSQRVIARLGLPLVGVSMRL